MHDHKVSIQHALKKFKVDIMHCNMQPRQMTLVGCFDSIRLPPQLAMVAEAVCVCEGGVPACTLLVPLYHEAIVTKEKKKKIVKKKKKGFKTKQRNRLCRTYTARPIFDLTPSPRVEIPRPLWCLLDDNRLAKQPMHCIQLRGVDIGPAKHHLLCEHVIRKCIRKKINVIERA